MRSSLRVTSVAASNQVELRGETQDHAGSRATSTRLEERDVARRRPPARAESFLVRRYAASAPATLAVVAAAVGSGTAPRRAVLLGLAVWFGAQGAVAVWGITTGRVGGLAWLALFADPLIAWWFAALSRRVERTPAGV